MESDHPWASHVGTISNEMDDTFIYRMKVCENRHTAREDDRIQDVPSGFIIIGQRTVSYDNNLRGKCTERSIITNNTLLSL